jgi:hypothetical protein
MKVSKQNKLCVLYNFVTEELRLIVFPRKENSPWSDYHLFPALKQDRGTHKFKDGR